jgi:hypothetical protein
MKIYGINQNTIEEVRSFIHNDKEDGDTLLANMADEYGDEVVKEYLYGPKMSINAFLLLKGYKS